MNANIAVKGEGWRNQEVTVNIERDTFAKILAAAKWQFDELRRIEKNLPPLEERAEYEVKHLQFQLNL